MSQPSWEKDPTTRHEYRWWDGEQWTEHVGDDGVASLDPLTGAEDLEPPSPQAEPPQAVSSGPTDHSDRPPELATRLSRFGARLIDALIFGALLVAVLFALHFTDIRPMPTGEMSDNATIDEITDYWQDNAESIVFLSVLSIITAGVYEVIFTALKGQTPGKMATSIRVVRVDDLHESDWGRPPSWGQSLARWVLPSVLGIPTFFVPLVGELLVTLCYLSLTWDRKLQGWHDKVARTFVIKKA